MKERGAGMVIYKECEYLMLIPKSIWGWKDLGTGRVS